MDQSVSSILLVRSLVPPDERERFEILREALVPNDSIICTKKDGVAAVATLCDQTF